MDDKTNNVIEYITKYKDTYSTRKIKEALSKSGISTRVIEDAYYELSKIKSYPKVSEQLDANGKGMSTTTVIVILLLFLILISTLIFNFFYFFILLLLP